MATAAIEIPENTSRKMAFLSFVFAVAVVVIHCSWPVDTVSRRLAVLLFRDTLARMAVPFFFTLSGFLIARHFDEAGWWRREMWKRVKSLALPYAVWTGVLALVMWGEAGMVVETRTLGYRLSRLPALVPLWYVRCLMLFMLCTPLLDAVVHTWKHRAIAVLYVAALSFATTVLAFQLPDEGGVSGFLHYGFSLEGLFYFSAGVYLQRFHIAALDKPRSACLLAVGVLLIILRLVFEVFLHVHVVPFRVVLTPLVLVGLWGVTGDVRLPAFLSGCAFPIYLMHGVVLISMRLIHGSYCACNPWLELAMGVVVPVLLYNVVRRCVPRVTVVLFGGR